MSVRLGVYSDLEFWQRDGRPVAQESFLLFAAALRPHVEALVVAGRLAEESADAAYAVPDDAEFVALPHYAALSRPTAALRAVRGSLRAFGALIDRVDAVWLLGPHPLAIAFALQARRRGRAVVLGVRQDLPAYVRTRHPRRPDLLAAGYALEGAWRLLARACPVVVVGPDLARRYRRARAVLPAVVSLVRAADVAPAVPARPRSPREPFRVLAVGRLDPEKNPLLLADVLAALVERGVDARLTVCGTGTLHDALAARLAERGGAERAELLGHVSLDGALRALYSDSDALLHVSWTEGVPQVLFEAFAAGLPVVATAVGGVPEQVGDAAVLVPPGSARAAADALASLARDPALGERLAGRGLERVRARTLESESARVAAFIAAAVRGQCRCS